LQTPQQKFPNVLKVARGVGLMIGIEFQPQFKAIEIVKELHKRNLLTVPAGNSVIRLVPALNLSRSEAEEGLSTIQRLIVDLAQK
jgi:acetylornithine/succinyldiaminopimelate/putrescine aminotransferase